jgi:hypothetical protein
MIDDWILSLLYSAWLAASTMPLGFMLGSSCSPCCGCGVADGKPRTDPKDEGTWVPSGTWRGAGGVTWTFTANPGDESGETWFFYGSPSTSRVGGGATIQEVRDWRNLCNWYSNKTTSPSDTSSLTTVLDKRATRLPPDTAVVHVYSELSTYLNGPETAKNVYFWSTGSLFFDNARFLGLGAGLESELTATSPAYDSAGGVVFNNLFAQVEGDAIINGGATFNNNTLNNGVVNGGATFNSSTNAGVVNDGAVFFGTSVNASSTVNDGATFNDNSVNDVGTVNGGATFNNNTLNNGVVNGGATFNDNSVNETTGTVNGGATFNDAACTKRFVGSFFASPCTRKFVAHPTDLPTCNGTAPDGCANAADTCGCG